MLIFRIFIKIKKWEYEILRKNGWLRRFKKNEFRPIFPLFAIKIHHSKYSHTGISEKRLDEKNSVVYMINILKISRVPKMGLFSLKFVITSGIKYCSQNSLAKMNQPNFLRQKYQLILKRRFLTSWKRFLILNIQQWSFSTRLRHVIEYI